MINMMIQNYCMINEQTNVCDNLVLWDGNTDTWTPPPNELMLVQADTPTKIWGLNPEKNDYILVVVMGGGGVGFTWDGEYLTTNEPYPGPVVQPNVTGAQTL